MYTDDRFLLFRKHLSGSFEPQMLGVIVLDKADVPERVEDRLERAHEIVSIEFPAVMNGDLHGNHRGLFGKLDQLVPVPCAGTRVEQIMFPQFPQLFVGIGRPVFPPQFVGRRRD